MNLVLIGYRGTGKSCVARALGSKLGREVVGLDAELERRAGMSITELVAQRGWPAMRDLEEALCREYGAGDERVIDCGGGVVEREANLVSLRSRGRVFWLKASVATIVARLEGDTSRPSLTGTKSFLDEVSEVLARREPLYARFAHAAVDTDGRTVEELAAKIASFEV